MMKRARPLLGTFVEITAEGPTRRLSAAIEAAFASIERVQRVMSFHDLGSDVSRINAAAPGQALAIDWQTFAVLQFARHLASLSAGAFDVTTAPVLVANGFLPKDSSGTIPVGATYVDLELLPENCIRWRRKGWIDLGGIAKGYAVDCAIATLRAHGIETGIVNAGGDLRCFGAPQPVHIRHPNAPTLVMQFGWLVDAALASSAGYFSKLEANGQEFDPLVDPWRRCCVNWDASISVVAPDAMTADALTKVIRLKPDVALDILDRFGAQAVIIDHVGMRCCGRALLRVDVGTCDRAPSRRCA